MVSETPPSLEDAERSGVGTFLVEEPETRRCPMAKNTGDGYRRGQVSDRYQQYNPTTDRYDKFDGNANYLDSKVTPGKWKGIEERNPEKPSRD